MQTLSPVLTSEREIFIDVFRGFGEALLIKNGNHSEKNKQLNLSILKITKLKKIIILLLLPIAITEEKNITWNK